MLYWLCGASNITQEVTLDDRDCSSMGEEKEVQYTTGSEVIRVDFPKIVDLGDLDVRITGVSVITWMAARERSEDDFADRMRELERQVAEYRETTFAALREIGKRTTALERDAERQKGGK
jgi:hypothetical protein